MFYKLHEKLLLRGWLRASDKAACAIFKGGWIEKIRKTMEAIDPKIRLR